MTPEELNKFLKQLGVYHDLYCKEGAPEAKFSDKTTTAKTPTVITELTTEAVITDLNEKLSLKPEEIITKPDERLSLGGPKN